jgi:predicted MFS family arabinose efflux permease
VRGSLAPLREREFRLLFVGRFASYIGSAIAPIALAFAVIDDLEGSPTDLGLVLMAAWLPQIVFVLVGGVFADRLPRHFVLVGSNVLSGGAQAFAAVLLLTGSAQIWHLAALQVARGIASSFFYPASSGIVPQTVSAPLLQQANALLRLTTNVAFVLGTAAGGIVVATVGSGWAIAFDAGTYFLSAGVLAFMRIPGAMKATSSFLRELADGWTEFRSREWLWVIVLAALFGNMVSNGSMGVLGPVVAEDALGGAAAWGAILAAQATGLVLGGLIALRLKPQRPLLVAQISVLFWGLPLAALALELPTVAIASVALVAGIGVELFGVYWDTALQQHVPQEALSRVSSYDALGSFVAIPIGLSIVGPVSAALGVSATLWVGLGIFLTAQGGALLSREVRTLRRRDDTVAVDPTPEPAVVMSNP